MGFWEDVAKTGLAFGTGGVTLLHPDAQPGYVTDILDPGKEERDRAAAELERNRQLAGARLGSAADPFEFMTPERVTEESMVDPATLAKYSYTPRYVGENERVDPRAKGVTEKSSFADNADLESAVDYFKSLSRSGHDAIADADFQAKQREAEQRAQAQREADLAALETKGMSGSGMELLSGLQAAQDQAQNASAAGLGANAMAAQRRDYAAGTGADLAGRVAQGQDQWAGGWNDYLMGAQEYNADKVTSAKDKSWERQNTVGDANVGNELKAQWWNKTLPQQQFQNETTVTNQITGANQGIAGQHNAESDAMFKPWDDLFIPLAQGATAYAAGKKPGG